MIRIPIWTAWRRRISAQIDLEHAAAMLVALRELQSFLDAGRLEPGTIITTAAACQAAIRGAEDDTRSALLRLGVPIPTTAQAQHRLYQRENRV